MLIKEPDKSDEVIALPPHLVPFAVRAANECIPVNAIARILRQPGEEVWESLNDALQSGAIVEIPRADWPPTANRRDRVPTIMKGPMDTDTMFKACMRVFKVTRLQATVLVCLLRHDHAEKSMLHSAIESRRIRRLAHNMDETNPKMVDVVICALRTKLKEYDMEIKTAWGSGYYMNPVDRKKGMALIAASSLPPEDANA